MSRRSYEQICGLAQALDLIGERWTMLVIRELLLGPKRFGALQQALTGISANLLSTRLRELAENGLIESVELPPPATGVSAYALTERGRGLGEPLEALTLWGMDLLEPESQAAAGWSARGSLYAASRMAAARHSGALDGLPATTVNAEVGGEQFVISVGGDGSGEVHHGAAPRADAEIACGLGRFYEIASGRAELEATDIRDGGVERVGPVLAVLAE